MNRRLFIFGCLLVLGLALICPSLCMGSALANADAHSCCSTSSPSANETGCTTLCSLHQDLLVPGYVDVPQLDVYCFAVIPFSLLSRTSEFYFSAWVPDVIHPPGHLVFLRTIRLLC